MTKNAKNAKNLKKFVAKMRKSEPGNQKVHFCAFWEKKSGTKKTPVFGVFFRFQHLLGKSRARTGFRVFFGSVPGGVKTESWDQDRQNVPPDFSQSKGHNRT